VASYALVSRTATKKQANKIISQKTGTVPADYFIAKIFLARFRQFAHAAQAASANIHCTRNAVNFYPAMLHIQYKAATSAAL
jgi:hypothetical protein